jgi:calcium permeable stress-gated cation channel
MDHYILVRQEYLVSPAHISTVQACSILITGIPHEYLSEPALTRLFGQLPGGVRKVWLNRNLGDIPDLFDRRLLACNMLEAAETSLLKKAIKRHKKQQKKVTGAEIKEKSSADAQPGSDTEAAPKTHIEELVPREKWPSHRLPLFSWMPFSLPFLGTKVDTIEWASNLVHEYNTELIQKRQVLATDIARTEAAEAHVTQRTHTIGAGIFNIAVPAVQVTLPFVGAHTTHDYEDQTYPPMNGAFILFNKQIAAHMAAHILTHHKPYQMSNALKYVEVAPDDVIWENLTLSGYERRVRLAISWAATIGIIIVWAIPGRSHLCLK